MRLRKVSNAGCFSKTVISFFLSCARGVSLFPIYHSDVSLHLSCLVSVGLQHQFQEARRCYQSLAPLECVLAGQSLSTPEETFEPILVVLREGFQTTGAMEVLWYSSFPLSVRQHIGEHERSCDTMSVTDTINPTIVIVRKERSYTVDSEPCLKPERTAFVTGNGRGT